MKSFPFETALGKHAAETMEDTTNNRFGLARYLRNTPSSSAEDWVRVFGTDSGDYHSEIMWRRKGNKNYIIAISVPCNRMKNYPLDSATMTMLSEIGWMCELYFLR
ncbi:hypothetical protein GX645_06805 [Candidatus Sumerlaeota bacterium]|nr:hypothetical protein [Candidatus Sumerlaeales bacterium]NLD62148.1 hypothetical protein [Candidatus Sumerlaeota bacterium]